MNPDCEKYNKINGETDIFCCLQKPFIYPTISSIRQTIAHIQKYYGKMDV